MELIRPVRTLKRIFITSFCFRGLYFMRILYFLGVTITFSFIFEWVLFVFVQLSASIYACSLLNLNYWTSFCRISTEVADKETLLLCYTTFQLITSLAGILMQRGLSCSTCAWQSFLSLCPDVAWLMHSKLVKWNLVTFQWQLFSLCSRVTTHEFAQINTLRTRSANNTAIARSNCFHVDLEVALLTAS